MDDFLIWEADEDGIVTLTMNRPEARNALAGEAQFSAIEAAVARANADCSVRVVILTGAGPAFCAGGDVKDIVSRAGMFAGAAEDVRQQYRAGVQRIPRALESLDVPLIAAVNGPAIGAGCDLALMADLRIASTAARFGETFVKLGLIPGDGGAWFLSRLVGPARAAEMILTGDVIDAQTALEWGIVSRVTSPEALLAEAKALGARIAANPPNAVRMAKALLRQARMASLPDALELAASLQAIAHHGREHEAVLEMMRRGKA